MKYSQTLTVPQMGFTLSELLITMSIMATLLALTTITLSSLQQRTRLDSVVTTVLSEIKFQQSKAMLNDMETQSTTSRYGIYFEPTRYTLFRGSTFVSGAPTNQVVNLQQNVHFTNITLPQQQLVFERNSGEVVNFTAGSNTFSIQNTVSGEQQTITINQYGAITQVQ